MEGMTLQQFWLALLLSTPRFVGIAIFLPFLRAPQIPPMVRNIVVFVLGLVVLPLIWRESLQDLGTHVLFALVLKEVVAGLILGFIISMTFVIPQAIGDFIENQRGASIASTFNPAFGSQASPLGAFLSQAFIVWFIAAGGMLLLVKLMLTSFEILPIASFLPKADFNLWRHSVDAFSLFLRLTMIIAAPIIFSMLISEIALGLVSRFAPQLNVFFISMSLKSMIAILILLFYFSNMLGHIWREGLFFETGYLFLRGIAQ